jgi:cobalamin biosynthesis protein CbiG
VTGRYVVGVGLASTATAEELMALVDTALAEAGIGRDAVTAVATIDTRRHHPAVVALAALGRVVSFPAAELASVSPRQATPPATPTHPAPHPPAVAEPAALRAAGEGATLVVPKRKAARATVAVARVAGEGASGSVTTIGVERRHVRQTRQR